MARYRLVPYSEDTDPQVLIKYLPSYEIQDEDDEPPVDRKDHMALVYYTIYQILSMSDRGGEINRSGRFYAMYRDFIENRRDEHETGMENFTRMNKEFL